MLEWFCPKKACQILSCSTETLRRWDKQNKIKTFRTPGGHRRYNVNEYLNSSSNKDKNILQQKKICYCRVSSKKQMDDLERQKDYNKQRYPHHEVISDIGSGLNWKRKGLLSILEQANRGTL